MSQNVWLLISLLIYSLTMVFCALAPVLLGFSVWSIGAVIIVGIVGMTGFIHTYKKSLGE